MIIPVNPTFPKCKVGFSIYGLVDVMFQYPHLLLDAEVIELFQALFTEHETYSAYIHVNQNTKPKILTSFLMELGVKLVLLIHVKMLTIPGIDIYWQDKFHAELS